jgi:UDP-N-acetylglucosamine acyltransferase
MLKHSHVGHDCFIHSKVTISCGVKVGGHTIVRYKCNLGLNAVIHQKQDIAIGCMIGMGAVVTKKLITEAFKKYAGNPAKEIGDNAIYRNP